MSNKTKPVWVAWTNTDLTEGKGYRRVLCVCEAEATAIRLGYKKSVMGSNCPVTKETAARVNGQWLVPGYINPPSRDDVMKQKKMDAKAAALKKAQALGLTEDEISYLAT